MLYFLVEYTPFIGSFVLFFWDCTRKDVQPLLILNAELWNMETINMGGCELFMKFCPFFALQCSETLMAIYIIVYCK